MLAWFIRNCEFILKKQREKANAWNAKNRERVREKQRLRRAENPEREKAYRQKYFAQETPEIKARKLESGRNWQRRNYAANSRLILESNKRFRLLHRAIQGKIDENHPKFLALVGCTPSEFRTHLAAKMQPGMTFENHGRDTWHADHIKARTDFDQFDPEQVKQCWHFSNTQPLWAKANREKSNLPQPA